MQKELAALKSGAAASSGDKFQRTAAKSKATKPPVSNAQSQGVDGELSEAAKLARLRRLCERKPSGRIQVPQELHERWLKANSDERLAMANELEETGWNKDPQH